MGRSGGNHMHQLCLIGGRHHDETGQIGKVGNVKRTGVCGPVGTDQSGTVNGKADRQSLNGNVMHHLIIPTLQERGIHRAKRFHPPRSHGGGKRNAMLFGNPHIKTPRRIAFCKQVQSGAIGHRCSHGANLVVTGCFVQQALGKNTGIAWRV